MILDILDTRAVSAGHLVARSTPAFHQRPRVHGLVSSVLILTLITSPLAGCATTRGPRQIGFPAESLLSDWSRVRALEPGVVIAVTAAGMAPATRHFVTADDSVLIVLNLNDPLPASAGRVLSRMAAEHPHYFLALQSGNAFAEGDVRIGRDGVLVGGRKVAEVAQIVETVPRTAISEIQGLVVARGSVAGALLGGWIGFAVGAVPALGGAPGVAAGLLLVTSVVVGGWLGFHWSSHVTDGVVYRAAGSVPDL